MLGWRLSFIASSEEVWVCWESEGELARKSKRLKLISLYSVKAQSFEMTYCHDLSDVLGEGKWIV